ncbi:hypothetical protein ACWCQP_47450 [Streptomyces chartreusis]
MKNHLALAAAVTQTTEKIDAPSPLQIAVALTVGVLVALAAGFLHRSDRPTPTSSRHSKQASAMRAGIALFGSASLTLATLVSPHQDVSLLILLLSAAAGAIYGLLAFYDTNTIQAAVWRGATAAASATTLGQAFLALYGSN